MVSKLCDSCKSATATLFCRPDCAFLCVGCDSKVHAINNLASRHPRVWVCEVCEQAPAHVTCKADAAALCVTCDRDIHSANPLARRHERVPVTPFCDPINSVTGVKSAAINFLDDRYFSDAADGGDADVSREEAEAASWLLPNPSSNPKTVESADLTSGRYVFSEMDPYLDLDYGHGDPKVEAQEQNSSGTDGVVPVQSKNTLTIPSLNEPYLDMDFTTAKPFAYGYNTQCLSQTVSSSSLDVSVVPDPDGGNTISEISNSYNKSALMEGTDQAVQLSGADREARVLRYREKRKNRKFEKTIRYASRKAYAETRPRIKGRFARRSDVEIEVDHFAGYGVVPSC